METEIEQLVITASPAASKTSRAHHISPTRALAETTSSKLNTRTVSKMKMKHRIATTLLYVRCLQVFKVIIVRAVFYPKYNSINLLYINWGINLLYSFVPNHEEFNTIFQYTSIHRTHELQPYLQTKQTKPASTNLFKKSNAVKIFK